MLVGVVAFIGFLAFLRFVWYVFRVAYAMFSEPKDLKKLGVQWAIVTGASSGVGKCLATTLAGQGVSVAIVGRNDEALDQVAQEITGKGVECVKIVADFSEPGAAEDVFKKLTGKTVGALFACHGECTIQPLDKFTSDEIVKYNHAMMTSNVLLAKYFLRQVGDFGTITYISSANTFMCTPFATNYGSVKRFLNQFGHMLRIESKHVTVQVINPGHIADTGFFKSVPEGLKWMTQDPPGTLTPATVTKAILATVGMNCDIDIGWDCVLYRCLFWIVPTPVMDFVMRTMGKQMSKSF